MTKKLKKSRKVQNQKIITKLQKNYKLKIGNKNKLLISYRMLSNRKIKKYMKLKNKYP